MFLHLWCPLLFAAAALCGHAAANEAAELPSSLPNWHLDESTGDVRVWEVNRASEMMRTDLKDFAPSARKAICAYVVLEYSASRTRTIQWNSSPEGGHRWSHRRPRRPLVLPRHCFHGQEMKAWSLAVWKVLPDALDCGPPMYLTLNCDVNFVKCYRMISTDWIDTVYDRRPFSLAQYKSLKALQQAQPEKQPEGELCLRLGWDEGTGIWPYAGALRLELVNQSASPERVPVRRLLGTLVDALQIRDGDHVLRQGRTTLADPEPEPESTWDGFTELQPNEFVGCYLRLDDLLQIDGIRERLAMGKTLTLSLNLEDYPNAGLQVDQATVRELQSLKTKVSPPLDEILVKNEHVVERPEE